MNFSDFLRKKRTDLRLDSALLLFKHYGSESKLKISFRQFQNIENGTQPPSPELLCRIINQEDPSSLHILVGAYFQSHLSGTSEADRLLRYLDRYLVQALVEGHFSWDQYKYSTYSELQLDYLISNPDAMRFHRRMVLVEKIPRRQAHISARTLRELEELELISTTNTEIKVGANRFRLPRFGKAAPRIVAKGHELMIKTMDLFAAREGNANQEIAYSFQLVKPEIARIAREQVQLLNGWIQSHVSPLTRKEDPTLVPLIAVSFCKQLDLFEIDEGESK